MIIDTHCHAGRGDLLTWPWNTDAPIEPHLERARAAGIDRTVVFAINNTDYERANAEVAEIVAAHPDELMGFVRLHAQADKGRVNRLVETAVRDYGFCGMKIHGGDALPTREVCEAAQAFNLPVLVDIVDQPQSVDMFASAYPDVNFIIAHLGSFSGNCNVHLRIVEQMARYPNVYADTSSVRFFDYLPLAIERAGAGKLLFGSDGPLLHPGIELQKALHLGLSADDQDAVLSGNFLRLTAKARGEDYAA